MPSYIWNLQDLEKVNKNGYKVFSCFSCGGGSSMGYKLAGYDVIGNCEIDKAMNSTYLKNFTPKYNYEMPIQEMVKLNEYPEELYNLDILDGSPPCSTFSMAGQREKNWGKEKTFREGQAKQVLDDLFFEYIKLAEKIKPKVIVAENVKGLINGNAKGYVNLIIKRLNEIGYQTQIFLLNAATMGVPQRRERVFFIATRTDLKLSKIQLNFNEKPITYGEFADKEYKPFDVKTASYQRWTKRISSDNSLGDTAKRTEHGKISQFNSKYFKLEKTPNTLTANGQMVRYDKPGTLSKKDITTIQTFPQDYNFNGEDTQYICGMSVPPIMMYKIAEQIKIQLLDKLEIGRAHV